MSDNSELRDNHFHNMAEWTLDPGRSSMTDAFPPSHVSGRYGLGTKKYDLNMERLHRYRVGRLRAEMDRRDCDALLLLDPVNIRYATGSRNMQVWTMRHPGRYCLVAHDRIVLFEMGGRVHHAAGLPIIDELRTARPWFFYYAGPEAPEHARSFATEIADLLGHNAKATARPRLFVDRCDQLGLAALRSEGVCATDNAQELMEHARAIKSEDEISATRMAIDVCEAGIDRIGEALKPGVTELSMLSLLHQANIELGGEYIETRLLTSGARTNPWHQEASHKEIRAGELVTFDCDLIGPLGYGADLSRVLVCGQAPNVEQKDLYCRAYDQIMFNTELLRVGTSFSEIIEKARRLPPDYHQWHRVAHGNGMSTGEYPAIGRRPGFESGSIHQGHIEEGMVLCVGTFAGRKSGGEGVKLEHQLVIRANGAERLSSSLYDPDFCE